MNRTFDTTLPAGRSAGVLLPWQGCWQARARDLAAPAELMAACLPLVVVQDRDRYRIGLLRYNDHEHVAAIRVQLDGSALKLGFTGHWDASPQWTVKDCNSYPECVVWIRGQFPVLQVNAGLSFKRMFILDIHDPYDNLLQTFGDVSAFVRQCADRGLSEGTLYYLPGWSGTFDKNYPDYTPAVDAGGEDAFAELVRTARKCGGEIFPHINHWALSHHVSARYPQLVQHVLRDAAGNRAEWPGYLWCGVGHPLYYIDPSSEPWIEIMHDRLTRLEKLGLKTVFMDQVGTPMCNNVGKPTQTNENWRPQMVAFMHRITKLHPRMVMGCESFTLDALPGFPLAQFWGPVWSASMEMPRLKPCRLLADAIGSSAQLVGHLGTLAPYPCRYAWTNYLYLAEHGSTRSFRKSRETHTAAGVLPTVRLISTFTKENQRFLGSFKDAS